ncbi:MAG: hypothetical protein NTY50_10960 [Methylobacter sp.]|nr:hypothetical protein [Methylobacter sp.]
MASNKINILLIEDEAAFCFSRYHNDVVINSEQYKKYFQLYWLQTPAEAVWLLDAYDELSIKAPQDILALGLPPEILIFDYRLSSPKTKLKSPKQASNIVEQLRTYLIDKGISVLAIDEYKQSVPSVGMRQGKDKMGCYIGGTLARAFSGYPCAAIPTTAKGKDDVKIDGDDADFFEWINRKYLKNAFDDKPRQTPNMEGFINYGIKIFREKVIDLINSGLIRIRLYELELLSRNPTDAKLLYLSISSNLGYREIPIAGLFIDTSEDQNAYEETAKEWAIQVLESMFKNDDFLKAKEIAKIYFESFYTQSKISNARQLRENFSNLASHFPEEDINSLTQQEKADLLALCNRFNVNLGDVTKNPTSVKIHTDSLPVWKQYQKINDSIARWVVLMLIVRAAQYAQQYRCNETISANDVHKLLNPLPNNLLIDETNNTACTAVGRLKLSVDNILKQEQKKKGLLAVKGIF